MYTKKLKIYSIISLLTFLSSFMSPIPVFADDPLPPAEETVTEEVETEETGADQPPELQEFPLEELAGDEPPELQVVNIEELAGDEPEGLQVVTLDDLIGDEPDELQVVPLDELAGDEPPELQEFPLETLDTEESVPDESADAVVEPEALPEDVGAEETANEDAENVAEIVADAAEKEITLADESGDPLPMATVETVKTLAEGDPAGELSATAQGLYSLDASVTNFNYLKADSSNLNGTCSVTGGDTYTCYWDTPVQKAVDDAKEDSIVSIAAGSYHEAVTIEKVKGLRLTGVGGDAIIDHFILKADVGTSTNVFAPLVTVFGTGNIPDGIMLAQIGGEVKVEPGEYTGEITIDKELTVTGVIGGPTNYGAGSNAPKIKATTPGSGTGVTISTDNVTLRGFIIEGFETGVLVQGGASAPGMSGTDINNNTFINNTLFDIKLNDYLSKTSALYNVFSDPGYSGPLGYAIYKSPDSDWLDAWGNYWGEPQTVYVCKKTDQVLNSSGLYECTSTLTQVTNYQGPVGYFEYSPGVFINYQMHDSNSAIWRLGWDPTDKDGTFIPDGNHTGLQGIVNAYNNGGDPATIKVDLCDQNGLCYATAEPTPVCGNNIVESGEACDDGNLTNGDGCSATCEIEGCTDPAASNYNSNATVNDGSCTYVCGNGVENPGEACDDGNLTNGDGCSATCAIEVAECGNGTKETWAGETCDDGNTLDGDGCSAICTTEIGGCTNPLAPEYDEAAVWDDGSCSPGGCTKSRAPEYDPKARWDNGSCSLGGCMDPEAINFNPDAVWNTGYCRYIPKPIVYYTGLILVTGGETHAIAAGIAHTCALTPEGGVECWGNNDYGQLGDGTNTASNVRVDVEGLQGGTTIVAGGNHTCVLAGGEVWCWGQNANGQIGDGTTTNRNVPVKVLSGAVDITAGLDYTCAVMTYGQVMCWGNNSRGQLADGGQMNHNSPTLARLITGLSNIDAGQNKNCGLTPTGMVRCVSSSSEELGEPVQTNLDVAVSRFGSTVIALNDQGVPVQFLSGKQTMVSQLSDVQDIDSGFGHVCAMQKSGIVHCWGSNNYGQLGNNSKDRSADPVAVEKLSDAWQLAVGKNHACVFTETYDPDDSGIRCWGLNTDGQLGDGTNENSLVPVVVK